MKTQSSTAAQCLDPKCLVIVEYRQLMGDTSYMNTTRTVHAKVNKYTINISLLRLESHMKSLTLTPFIFTTHALLDHFFLTDLMFKLC